MESLRHNLPSFIELLITSLLILIITLFIYVRYKLTFWKNQGIPNIVLHNYKSIYNVMHLNDWNCIKTYGKIVGTYELLSPTLLIAEPKLINQLLIEDFQKFSDHRIWTTPEQPIGRSLFSLDYDQWKPSRHLISPVFSSANIKKTRKIFESSTQLFMNNIKNFAINDKSFDIKLYFDSFVLDSILRSFFAAEVDSANDKTNPLVLNSEKIFMKDISIKQLIPVFAPMFAEYLDLRFVDRNATEFMTKLVQKIIDERKNCNIKNNDFLQTLLDSKDDNGKTSSKVKLDEKEVIDNCLLFLIAAFDTVASALTHLVNNLLTNPSTQENVIKEIDEKMNGLEPDFENLKELVYLEACIKESLRLNPSSVRLERKSVCDFKLGDIFIPKDTYITIPVKAVHRDPDNFENADQFIPERFSPENKHKIKSGTYLAFGDGPRNCIGSKYAMIEMKYVLAKLFKKYRLINADETEPIEYHTGQIIAAPKKLNLKVENRSRNK